MPTVVGPPPQRLRSVVRKNVLEGVAEGVAVRKVWRFGFQRRRRTCATWLREAGAPPDLIAPLMGHADTRMVERVYGRLPIELLEKRLAEATGSIYLHTGVTDSVEITGLPAPAAKPLKQKTPRKAGSSRAQGQNRTADTGIFNPLLYQLSYLGVRPEPRRANVLGEALESRKTRAKRVAKVGGAPRFSNGPWRRAVRDDRRGSPAAGRSRGS